MFLNHGLASLALRSKKAVSKERQAQITKNKRTPDQDHPGPISGTRSLEGLAAFINHS
jgi:hypothetical protein